VAQAATTVSLYPKTTMNPIVPPIIKPTSPVTQSVDLAWFPTVAPGTSIVEYQLYYQYNNGAWVFWQTFSGQTTSTQFNFQQVNPALGDGFYAFAVTARNNLNQQQPFNNVAQASVILDLADKIQPASFMPLISR
ncbi:MAG: fibronectin type III domain-containing protein, partial [Caldilineaceae bacterium]|nr:fibronectin type III domain-containing protein [Caldilineaceae bacterium]